MRTHGGHRRRLALPWLVLLLAGAPASGGDEPAHGDRRANRLIHASSPYLLQHAYNPVDWHEWGDEAFARAVAEDKPIFLSIGYAACHWCHVMERESFENDAVADVLNEHFICIKVDREERPDIDEIYMAATVAMTGRGGWPMTILMTPDKKPFACGTYFPPEDRGGRRGLRPMCLDIADKWRHDRAALLRDAGALVDKVRARKRTRGGAVVIDRGVVSRYVDRVAGSFDPVLGGRRSARNKFPPTMDMELMLRAYASQREVSKPELLDPVATTLDHMAAGGIYDHIGGGICRYSTDPRWFAPHFEKMLYDQATVSGVYLSAYQLLGDKRYARVARSILDYCIADLQDQRGGFYSSRDADSEGQEGKFYVWRKQEIDALLSPDDAPLFGAYYNVTERGNWHRGLNILHVTTTDAAFARDHGMTTDQWRDRLQRMRSAVRAARARRVPPALDDKILVEWNGLLITSLARAYRILDEPRYRDAARRAADFILSDMVVGGRLHRVHRRGKTYNAALATDYTNFVEALITLYETTFERKYLDAAERLHDTFVAHFRDPEGRGFFYTANDAETLLVRSKNPRDGVVPSGNSVAALNALRLSILLGRPELRTLAEDTMRAMQPMLQRGALARMQWAVLFYHDHPREIAIVGDPGDPATNALITQVYRGYIPNKVVALATPSDAARDDALPLLQRKKLIDGKPAAYVCRNYLCGRPVTTPADLATQLAGIR
ncbi:MAG: thioredoxin domain-containing protein [Phycisphaerae bacterium]